MKTVDGKALAQKIRKEVKQEVAAFGKKGRAIVFHAVLVGDNPASHIYVNMKKRACDEVGIDMRVDLLPANVSQSELEGKIRQLSNDDSVHAILLQLPLPEGLNAAGAIACIAPEKDVDGLTVVSFGKLASEAAGSGLFPCTPQGILHILKSEGVILEGANVTVIGRSNIVGKPVALMLMKEDATVTVCHKKTKDLAAHTRGADVVVVAAGCPGLVRADMVRDGAVVVDVGVNRLEDGTIVGDVDFEGVSGKARVITPVPGGVGPLTIAFLLKNVVTAAAKLR